MFFLCFLDESLEDIRSLFTAAGLVEVVYILYARVLSSLLGDLICHFSNNVVVQEECEYIRRQYANRGQGRARYRSWVHAKFRKPFLTCI